MLLTGHTGFKGAWLGLWLERLGAEVIGLSLPAEPDSLYVRAGLVGRWRESFTDIRDADAVRAAVRDESPDVIFHLAAQPLVGVGYAEPVMTFQTNVAGTMNVLDAARLATGVAGTVVVTTDKVYRHHPGGQPYLETDPLGGVDPYSASKSAAEHVATAWRALSALESGPRVVTARAGNVIGGGDYAAGRLLPDLIRAFAAGRTALLRHPDYTRPWQHVLDPLAGYLDLGERILTAGDVPDSVNFGPDADRTVGDVADMAVAAWGDGAAWVHEPDDTMPEMDLLSLDSSRAKAFLGWHPRWSTEDAVGSTIMWWKHHLNATSAIELCLADIERYSHGEPCG